VHLDVLFSNGSIPRIFLAVIFASILISAGLVHVSFAEINVADGNKNNNNNYSNLQFGIEKIELPKGWIRTIQEQNNTAAGTTDEITITLKLENATTSPASSPPTVGATNPFSLFSRFSSPTNGTNSFEGDNNNKSGADPFTPTITIKLQKGEALQRELAAEKNQTGGQQGQEIDLFAQNPYCKQLGSSNGSGTSSNNTTAIINSHRFTVTEQECDIAPILKLFFRAFFAGFANLANNNTINSQNNNNSSILLGGGGNATNVPNDTNTTRSTNSATANSSSISNNAPITTHTTNNTTSASSDKFTALLDTLHNIRTTEKKYTYTSPSSNLRVSLSYSALTFVSIEDFEIKAKHYERYLPVFEQIVHSVRIQQQ
jgi:hypothetical protein